MTRYVTRTFREQLEQRYPGLANNPAYWRFIHYLLFGTHRDMETGELVISQELLASIEDSRPQLASRNYAAEPFLLAFKREVLPGFRYSGWTYARGRARTVVSDGLDSDVVSWLEDMAGELVSNDADVVEVETGHVRTRRKTADQDAADRKLVET